MVKRIRVTSLLVFGLILMMGGCNNSAPVHPLDGPSLLLTVPGSAGGFSAKFTLVLGLEYRAVSGPDEVKGSLNMSQIQSLAGPIKVPLPHGGKWLVSAEWINANILPFYIGADEVDVQGATDFNLRMGNLDVSCYQITMADVASSTPGPDLFGFDNYFSGSSTITSGGDIQCVLDTTTIPSLSFQPTAGPSPRFTYLGNGDWVDYTLVHSDAVFHNNTLAAKRAVAGALSVMEAGDVYVMKLSPTTLAWFQVFQVTNLAPATSVDIFFRVNRHPVPYLKFDVTSYGDANCNTSGVTLF